MMGPRVSHPGSVTIVKAEEPWVKHKVSLHHYWSQHLSSSFLPDPGPPRKLLFKAYQASL
jgi:hypothetical protein